MATIALDAATEKLTHAVEKMQSDDLVQIGFELFPDRTQSKLPALKTQIVEHIRGGLAPEEVVDLWGVAFPRNREVYFNEEDGLLHYGEDDSRS